VVIPKSDPSTIPKPPERLKLLKDLPNIKFMAKAKDRHNYAVLINNILFTAENYINLKENKGINELVYQVLIKYSKLNLLKEFVIKVYTLYKLDIPETLEAEKVNKFSYRAVILCYFLNPIKIKKYNV
jgi:hypothetical protein